jgi:glycerol-3-phosphate acyltransferase PlsY
MVAAFLVTFAIGYLPTNKIFFFLKRIYLPIYIKYFSYKEAVQFLGSSNTLEIIFLHILKPILAFCIIKTSNSAEVYFWISGLILALGNTISTDIMKFRGTILVIVYLMLLQVPFAGTILAIYIFVITFSRSQSKASLISTLFLVALSTYYLSVWKIMVFFMPTAIFIYYDYGLLRFNSLNLLTFFTHKNNI